MRSPGLVFYKKFQVWFWFNSEWKKWEGRLETMDGHSYSEFESDSADELIDALRFHAFKCHLIADGERIYLDA